MVRKVMNDEIWEQLEGAVRGKGCHLWKNSRNVMEAILWKLRTGAPWRGIPESLCPWKTAYNRFNRLARKGLWQSFFKLRGEIDTEWVFADGSYIRAHQHASGARRAEERGIGGSCGGLTTKLHVCADAHGNPIDFEITGGEVHDSQVAERLIEKVGEGNYFIADKEYDAEAIRKKAKEIGMIPVIPRRSNSTKKNKEFDAHLYKIRHLVENIFARFKHFRGIATRFEKLARNFRASVYIDFSFIWMLLN